MSVIRRNSGLDKRDQQIKQYWGRRELNAPVLNLRSSHRHEIKGSFILFKA